MPDDATRMSIGARMHYECALAADRQIGVRPGYEFCAPIPVMLLMAFSIELALKAILLRSGKTLPEVKSIGHRLVLLYEAIPGKSFLDPQDFNTLKLLQEIHADEMVLRYYVRPRGDQSFPVFGPLQDVARKCLQMCSAPDLQEVIVR